MAEDRDFDWHINPKPRNNFPQHLHVDMEKEGEGESPQRGRTHRIVPRDQPYPSHQHQLGPALQGEPLKNYAPAIMSMLFIKLKETWMFSNKTYAKMAKKCDLVYFQNCVYIQDCQ